MPASLHHLTNGSLHQSY